MRNLTQRFIREEEGQDLVEYAFLIAFIALSMIATLSTLQGGFGVVYTAVGGAITAS